MRWGWGWGGGYGSPFWWLGPVLMALFWIAVLGGIVVLIRQMVRRDRGQDRDDTALQILQRRYARGEISKEQYEEMRRELS